MNMTASLGLALALLLSAGFGANALAQKTYRCGSVYQQYPCELSDGKGEVGTGGAGTGGVGTGGSAGAVLESVEARQRRERCERAYRDRDENDAQVKSAGSQITLEALGTQRRVFEAEIRRVCG